jgi:hypothetical protein
MGTLRELVYGLVSNDPDLGLPPESVFAGGAPDSPPDNPHSKSWAVLNWGQEANLLGGAVRDGNRPSARDCSLWVYDRDADFTRINAIIRRWCEIMDALEAEPTGSGFVIATEWQGDGADGWDDVYAANYRNSAYTIIASGD